MSRACAVDARMFTWDYVTHFDVTPTRREVESAFNKEFSESCGILQAKGACFAIWPLCSFHDDDEMVSRYLVAVTENTRNTKKNRRLSPRQIAMFSAADAAIRKSTFEDNSGNYWCYAVAENVLYMLVFYEGRLCYWSEESLLEGTSLDSLLVRFRCFLKTDALFSRAERFAEIKLDGPFDKSLFRKASRDPLWKNFDLKRNRKKYHGEGNLIKMVAAALALLMLAFWLCFCKDDDLDCHECVDALPIELRPVPMFVESEEPVEKNPVLGHGEMSVLRIKCDSPPFHLKGVVGQKIAVIAVSGETRSVTLGDSLGTFIVNTIGRDYLKLSCGDSIVERQVGNE